MKLRPLLTVASAATILGLTVLSWAAPTGPLSYYAIQGCRVLDTRNYNQDAGDAEAIPGQHALAIALSNVLTTVPAQGGAVSGCADIPDNPEAVVVTISAIAPGFPSTPFQSPGFATLLPFNDTGWTSTEDEPPSGVDNAYYTFDSPPFNAIASVLYQQGVSIITNTTTVQVCTSCTATDGWHALLYTSADAHFTLDVVGYFTSAE